MITRTLIAVAVVAALVTAGVWAKRTFAADVVKAPTSQPAGAGSTTRPAGPLDFAVKDIDGHDVTLSDYKGKVVVIVNVASKCGFTPQYKGLEKLYTTDKERGLVILGFPANNFNGQEPGSDEQIKQFCTSKYMVTFPMMSKVSVKGDDICPLYKYLTDPATAGDFAGDIGWNFTKFVVDRNGNVFARFGSATKPDDAKLVAAVEAALATK